MVSWFFYQRSNNNMLSDYMIVVLISTRWFSLFLNIYFKWTEMFSKYHIKFGAINLHSMLQYVNRNKLFYQLFISFFSIREESNLLTFLLVKSIIKLPSIAIYINEIKMSSIFLSWCVNHIIKYLFSLVHLLNIS